MPQHRDGPADGSDVLLVLGGASFVGPDSGLHRVQPAKDPRPPCQPLPAQNTGTAPGPAPFSGDPLGAVLPQPGAATQPMDNCILQMLLQQNPQMKDLQQNLALQQPAASAKGPGERYPPTPPPAVPLARPLVQNCENPWVAPGFSREPDVCRERRLKQEHICLHRYAPSQRSSVSAGSLQRADVAGFPGAVPCLPPVSSRQPCSVNQLVRYSESGMGRQEQLSPGAEAVGPSDEYAGSIMSSVASRHCLSISSLLRKLQKTI